MRNLEEPSHHRLASSSQKLMDLDLAILIPQKVETECHDLQDVFGGGDVQCL